MDQKSTESMWKCSFYSHPQLTDKSVSQYKAALGVDVLSDLSRLYSSVTAFILNLRSQECLFHLLSAAPLTSDLIIAAVGDVDLTE